MISCTISPAARPEAAGSEYQASLAQGWQYLNKRQHSRALDKFTAAQILRPEKAEPLHGRARALFYMARHDEVLAVCEELSGDSTEYFAALGFCWEARLEISRVAPAVAREVQEEIEIFLEQPEPTLALLYAAYGGYYHLKNREKRLPLLLRLAEEGSGSLLAEGIASALFDEIATADPDSTMRTELANSYLDHFPRGLMADKVAALILRDRLSKQKDLPDYWQIGQSVLADRESPLLNSAVAFWLIEHDTGYDQAIRLMQKNLQGFADYRQEVPDHFDRFLWQQEADKKYYFYKYLLGRAWLGKGELATARKLLEEVMERQKDWAGVYHFLGIIALKEERAPEAVEYFSTALARGTLRPETTKELRILLAEHHDFIGEPRAYFQARHGGARFREVTEEAGLGGVRSERVAWGDYDNDGDDDLLFDNTRIFENQGQDGFVELVQPVPLPGTGTKGGIWGDYDNDHFLDIFATNHGENYLFHNEAGRNFSRADILPRSGASSANTEAAAWGDVNNDGYLDLYVANYEEGALLRGQCGQDQLLLNRGGTLFTELVAGGGVGSEEAMCGRGVTWSDLNDDGWQDIVVANYRLDPNFLWLNQGNGSVVEAAESAGVRGLGVDGAYGHSIGSVSGDLDGDGDFDLFTSNLAHPRFIHFSDRSMVLINNGERLPKFSDRFRESGIVFDETSSDPLLFDVDLDGDLDLYITSIYRNSSSHLYINDGKGGFSDLTWLSGSGVLNGWGAAAADYDGDGYPDLLVASSDGVHLLHNEGGSHNWLGIRVADQNCNYFGVGSKVSINYGRTRQVREITAGRGTGSQDALTVSFGLGSYDGPVAIEVKTLCGDILQQQTNDLNRIAVVTNRAKKR